jgi:hypothetical protein
MTSLGADDVLCMIHGVSCSVALLCLGLLGWVPFRPRMVNHGTRPGDDLYTTPRLDSSDLSSSCTQKHHPPGRVPGPGSHAGWRQVPGPPRGGGCRECRRRLRKALPIAELSPITVLLDGHSRGRHGGRNRRNTPGDAVPASTGQALPVASARARSSGAAGMDASPGFRLSNVDSMQHGTVIVKNEDSEGRTATRSRGYYQRQRHQRQRYQR